jgi:retinal rod rhodopsin-sensitive cGMP 3',5'-cyclic phosphodiesterase subunit delta
MHSEAMQIKDADTGKLMWEKTDWPASFADEVEVHLPRAVLGLRAVTRATTFSSKEAIHRFRIVQSLSVHGVPFEEWSFKFNFVIPNTTNTYENTIDAAEQSEMIPAEVLSGNLVIATYFFDGDDLITKSNARIYYD